MYCRKCGKKMNNKEFCEYCGQGKEDIVLTGDEKKDAAAQVDYRTIGGMCIIISVILPPIGLIMSIIYLCTMKNNTTTANKEVGKRRLIISIIISALWSVLSMIFGIIKLIISALK